MPVAALKKCATLGLGVPNELSELPTECTDCVKFKHHKISTPETHSRQFKPGECWVTDTKG